MIIGILGADTLDNEPKQLYGSYADMFIKLLSSADSHVTYKVYQAIDNEFPEDLFECDAYLITGSQFSVYDNAPWIKKLKQFIKALNKRKIKLIGICFGHQLIAEALGGKVEKSHKGWGIGLMPATVVCTKSWMQPETEDFDLLLSHQDQVIKLPAEAELIASNSFCPISSFVISSHILTFQGHPEYVPGYLLYLMNKRKHDIGAEKYKRAMKTINNPANTDLIATWIIQFIKKNREAN